MQIRMNKGLIAALMIMVSIHVATAQSTADEVYNILQSGCTFSSCHDNVGPAVGLDLQGSGPGAMMEVYDNVVNVTPNNNHASTQGYKYILPGDPANSYLYRKINDGLDPLISLHPSEGGTMPQSGSLDETEIELVRQWILYGAPFEGTVVESSVIDEFYNNNGIMSMPTPPTPPSASEGFQVHLGPFFIPPSQEDEVFLKYDPKLDDDTEVTSVEVFMGNQSHHFILYKFFAEDQTFCGITGGDGPEAFADGFRGVDEASHTSANFLIGAQFPERIDLPYNTAFAWEEETVLDLNSHYINSSPTQVLSSDVYINVYTQPKGTAAQEMNAIMIPKTDFNIPNDGSTYTFSDNLPVFGCFPNGLFLWATTSHTHQLGQDYDIYKSNAAGQELDHIFDASCYLDAGEPDCASEFYDYQHPPTRVFDDYYHLDGTDWIKHEASFVNNGPEPVEFGFTSLDEMMLFFFFYVEDTTGLTPITNIPPTALNDVVTVMQDTATIIDVLENDSDADGMLDPTSVTILIDPSEGSATVNANGSITYDPGDGYTGPDEITYIVCDNGDPAGCDTGIVTITVEQVTGVFDMALEDLSVYPNPTAGAVFIRTGRETVGSVSLSNILGGEMRQITYEPTNDGIRIDLSQEQIADGIYWLQIVDKSGMSGIARVIYRSAP